MFLSLDSGATKTHLLFFDKDQNIIEKIKTTPLSFSVTSPQNAIKILQKILKNKLDQIDKAIFGLAGIDTLDEKLKVETIFSQNFPFPIQIINDAQMALTAGSNNKNAIVIIAGTGSNCFGRNSQNQTAQSSGLDYILTDEGSGYSIGSQILKSAVRSFDGRGLKTCLEDLVLDYFEVDNIYDLKKIVYHPSFTKKNIASLTHLLPSALKNNDKVANFILENNTGELLIALRPVIAKLNLTNKNFDLVLAGSLFTKKIIPVDYFINKVKQEFSQANIILLEKDPVFGGINLLLQNQ